ncbi:MAG: response regulator transcription factor [Sandaracinaceae bacterium]|nr:response regulator transcription factor [Sandaracinaceae bacterium]
MTEPRAREPRNALVVDDETRIRDVVQYALEREGFRVHGASSVREARAALAQRSFDLVVLDVMLPDGDGLELCKDLRKTLRTPVLFLSARGDEIDRILGLELGGDDYVTKPFSPRELVARVKAVLRRADGPEKEPERKTRLEHGVLAIDLERHEVRVRRDEGPGELVSLTPTELGLLASLLERPGIVLSRHQLMKRAYAYDNLVTERTIDTHVRRVRAKLRPYGIDPIATVHGVGYRAYDPDAPETSAATGARSEP